MKNKFSHNSIATNQCIDCNLCTKGCAMLRKRGISPQTVFTHDALTPSMAFSCTGCGYCEQVCPTGAKLATRVGTYKKGLSDNQKKRCGQGHRGVAFHQKYSFSRWFTTSKKFSTGAFRHFAFMPGCALSAYSPDLVLRIFAHLQSILPGAGILQYCCAMPTSSMGETLLFDRYNAMLRQAILDMKTEVIITACENCYMAIKNYVPNVQVRSLYDVLVEIGIPPRHYTNFISAVLHDPCPTRHEPILHESVRTLLGMMGIIFEEFPDNRENTLCCGSGGMLEMINPLLALELMQDRCHQTSCATIISYCQSCVESMSKGGKKGVHILDLIFTESGLSQNMQTKQSTFSRWRNRYRLKQAIDRIEGCIL